MKFRLEWTVMQRRSDIGDSRSLPDDLDAAPDAQNQAPAGSFDSDRRYGILFESNPHPMWVYDLGTLAFLAVNDAAIRQYGYSMDEFMRMTIKDIRPDEDISALLDNIATADGGPEQSGVWRHRTKNGAILQVEISSQPLVFNGRRGRLVLAADVTERARMEEELRRKSHDLEERVKELHCLHEVSEILLADGARTDELLERIVHVLPPSWQYPEITQARIEVEGREFRTPGFRQSPWTQSEPILSEGRRIGMVEVCYLKARQEEDEGPFLNEERNLIRQVAEKVGAYLARMQSRDALYESELRRSSVMNALVDGVIVINENGVINEFNPAAEKLFRYQAREVLGRKVNMLMPDPHRTEHDTYLQNYLITGEKKVIGTGRELTGMRKGGETFPFHITISEMNIGGRRQFLGILKEITEQIRIKETLMSNLVLLTTQQELSLDGIAVVGRNDETVSFNRRFSEMWSLPSELTQSSSNQEITDWVAKQLTDPDRFIEHVERLVDRKDGVGRDEISTRDGRIFDLYYSSMHGPEDEYLGRVWFFRDITERKNQENRILRLNRIHEIKSAVNTLIVRATDRQEMFDETCRVIAEIGEFGIVWIDEFDASGRDLKPGARAGADAHNLSAFMQNILGRDTDQSGLTVRAANARAINERKPVLSTDFYRHADSQTGQEGGGESGYASWLALPLFVDNDVVAVLSLLSRQTTYFDESEVHLLNDLAANISLALDRLSKQEQIRYLAFHDVVTGLPIRSVFIEHMEQALEESRANARSVAFVVIGIDKFRKVIASRGQRAADILLRTLGERLKSAAGDQGMPARTAEGRFAFMLRDANQLADVAGTVDGIIESCFSSPIDIEDRELNINGRAGIAMYPDDGDDAETLLNNAEAAFIGAGMEAQRYQFYSHELNSRAAHALDMEQKLLTALDKGQFELHYQTRVNAKTGAIKGLEALLRWYDPDSGQVMPDDFIPILEENGEIVRVGAWVLDQAMRDYRSWRAQGLPAPRITVNVSAVQLRQAGFLDMIREVIDGADEDDHGLDIELTESTIVSRGDGVTSLLKQIRDLGVKIAIDDFGTGHSSLRYIATLPVDALKIDRSFIENIVHDANEIAIVSAIISLGHQLDLIVVAEGVETEDQSRLLRLFKCDELQGFLFSRPVPAREIETMLRAQAGASRA